jgi:hypothetical protein
MAEGQTDAQESTKAAGDKNPEEGGGKESGGGSGASDAQPGKVEGAAAAKPSDGAGDSKADSAAKDGAGDKKPVPEKYDLKLSDGSLLDSGFVDKIAAIAREQGLSNEDAQTRLSEIETQAMQERNERVTAWNEALKSDKDFGGEKYAKSAESVKRYAGYLKAQYPEVLDLLERSGHTSHPAVAKFLRDMGDRMTEDKHDWRAAKAKQKRPPIEERMFPKSPGVAA